MPDLLSGLTREARKNAGAFRYFRNLSHLFPKASPPPIRHVMEVLAPFPEGLILPFGSLLPLRAANELDRQGHHLFGSQIQLINELSAIGHINN
ncbi:hypothetical protein [Pseudomonas sp. KK4]|uniref:hypothetical protein n=1 Tax=Pseudomonas sp. KK4 TaxID=1855729 RepID=UPI00158C3A4C|nr:hypothetical protein [Pseudomonas sp. KK4]